ncbi:hypothetical protein LCGC14_2761430, partial [marine sediment metagenome]
MIQRYNHRGRKYDKGSFVLIDEYWTLLAEIKTNNKTYRMAQDRANNDIETLTADIDEYQQQQDEIIVALGSKGILPSEIVSKVRSLLAESKLLEDAAYAFMRHIQDQIEQEAGWMQFDYYRPEIDVYEYKLFVEAIGDPSDQARWNDLLERSHKLNEQTGLEAAFMAGHSCAYHDSDKCYEQWKKERS